MSTDVLERIEAAIPNLSLDEQLQLLAHLAQRIRSHAQPLATTAQLAAMAADPEIQQEIQQIAAEFQGTEADGL